MTTPLATVMSWLLPPVCGGAAGALIGRLLLPRAAFLAAGRLTSADSPGAKQLERTLAEALGGLLASRETIYAVRNLITGLIGSLAARPMAEIWRQVSLRDRLSERLLPAISEEQRRREISESVGGLVARQAGQALGDEALLEVTAIVETAIPQASAALLRWLESEETRGELAARGRELLPKILGKLSDLQKLFLTAGQFDRRLNEKMPEIVDETVQALRQVILDPRQQERLLDVFSEAARGWRDSLLVTTVTTGGAESEPRQKLGRAASTLVDRFLAALEDPDQRRHVASEAAAKLEGDRRTLGAFARDMFGIPESEAVEMISARVLQVLTDPGTAQGLSRQMLAPLGRSLPPAVRQAMGSRGVGKWFAFLGGIAGLCAGLVVIALRLLGLV